MLKYSVDVQHYHFAVIIASTSTYYLFRNKSSTKGKARKRRRGAGRKAQLRTIKEKLFYILFYLKCYPTYDLASVLFDFDRSQAYRWVRRLQPILEKTLGEKKVLPLRKLSSIDEFIEHFPEVKKVIVDGTERPICRPKDKDKQKENYSGKKKRHTSKNLAAVAKDKRILVLTPSTKGKTHDKKIHDREDIIGRTICRNCLRNSCLFL